MGREEAVPLNTEVEGEAVGVEEVEGLVESVGGKGVEVGVLSLWGEGLAASGGEGVGRRGVAVRVPPPPPPSLRRSEAVGGLESVGR